MAVAAAARETLDLQVNWLAIGGPASLIGWDPATDGTLNTPPGLPEQHRGRGHCRPAKGDMSVQLQAVLPTGRAWWPPPLREPPMPWPAGASLPGLMRGTMPNLAW